MILPGFPLSGTVHLAEVVGSTISARGERRLWQERCGSRRSTTGASGNVPRHPDGVRELLAVGMDALARKSHETHDMKVKDEIERLLKEYDRLKEPWLFVSR